jgi:hypothetical protein
LLKLFLSLSHDHLLSHCLPDSPPKKSPSTALPSSVME